MNSKYVKIQCVSITLLISVFLFGCGQETPLKPPEDVTADVMQGYACLQADDSECLTEIISSYYPQPLVPDTEFTDLLANPHDYVGQTITIHATLKSVLDRTTFTLDTGIEQYSFFIQNYDRLTIPVNKTPVTVKIRVDRYNPGWFGPITKRWYDRSLWATFIAMTPSA